MDDRESRYGKDEVGCAALVFWCMVAVIVVIIGAWLLSVPGGGTKGAHCEQIEGSMGQQVTVCEGP